MVPSWALTTFCDERSCVLASAGEMTWLFFLEASRPCAMVSGEWMNFEVMLEHNTLKTRENEKI